MLAAVLLPNAVAQTAAAAASACRGETQSYCKNISLKQVAGCLLDRWDKLSPDCRDSLVDSPENPCLEDTRSFCQNVDPETSLKDCLQGKLHRLSARCKKTVLESLEKRPCYPAMKRFCSHVGLGSSRKIYECLLPHLEDISPSCFLGMRSSPMWPRPCEKDMARFCPGKMMDTPEIRAEGQDCLMARINELAPPCREAILWFPCALSAQTLCADQPPRQSRACLRQNKAKLPPRCQKALTLRQAQSPTRP